VARPAGIGRTDTVGHRRTAADSIK
jgi:hypothetical protein